MPLGSLLIPAYDYLRAYTTIRTFESSQVLAFHPSSILSKYLRLLQQIKLLLLLWKLQLTLAEMMAKGKKVEAPQGKEKNQDKGKGQTSDTTVSQSKQVADPEAPKAKA